MTCACQDLGVRSAFWIKGNGQRRLHGLEQRAFPDGDVAKADLELVEIKKAADLPF